MEQRSQISKMQSGEDAEELRWKVLMVKCPEGASSKQFDDYDRALMYAFAAKEDCESVSVYERDSDGWTKCFKV